MESPQGKQYMRSCTLEIEVDVGFFVAQIAPLTILENVAFTIGIFFTNDSDAADDSY